MAAVQGAGGGPGTAGVVARNRCWRVHDGRELEDAHTRCNTWHGEPMAYLHRVLQPCDAYKKHHSCAHSPPAPCPGSLQSALHKWEVLSPTCLRCCCAWYCCSRGPLDAAGCQSNERLPAVHDHHLLLKGLPLQPIKKPAVAAAAHTKRRRGSDLVQLVVQGRAPLLQFSCSVIHTRSLWAAGPLAAGLWAGARSAQLPLQPRCNGAGGCRIRT